MTSTKPYLIRAIWEWCGDQGFTPYVAVEVDGRTQVPMEFVRDGQIVLNLGAEATHMLELGNLEISFQARFNGAPFPVRIPVDRVAAIYARENGQGMGFEVGDQPAEEGLVPTSEGDSITADDGGPRGKPGGRPRLTRIK